MPLPNRIRLEIVSPERLLLSQDVDEVVIPGSEGYLGILPGHLPLLTAIGTGVLSFRNHGKVSYCAVSGGFAEVLGDRVIVIAETVELPAEIDVERARTARERAEKQLYSKDQFDVEGTMSAMLRASTRLHVAELGD